jgi:RNA 3'-terminal phosphate cyclase (ATP)
MIELDGSAGEVGGQVLRTALTLSMITGQPFRITNIRALRAKPGLMRQHLIAVLASAQVSESIVAGVPANVARRELDSVGAAIEWGRATTSGTPLARRAGPRQCFADHSRARTRHRCVHCLR